MCRRPQTRRNQLRHDQPFSAAYIRNGRNHALRQQFSGESDRRSLYFSLNDFIFAHQEHGLLNTFSTSS